MTERLPRLGPYELRRPIARGGMGHVWEAVRVEPPGDALVALKVLDAGEALDSTTARSFLDEARIEAALNHPNIVHVVDIGLESGRLYMAMELLDGLPLSALLTRTDPPLPVGLCVGIAVQALAALDRAHQGVVVDGVRRSVVHRDVKPSNVFLTRQGVVKLIDFGIASGLRTTGSTISSGSFKGTLCYASPEQVRNDPLDGRADLFSFAVVLHELLTHRRLFDQPGSAAVLNAILWSPIPPVRQTREDVPPKLEAVLLRALSRDPGERPPTAALFAAELRSAVTDDEVWSPEQIAQWMAMHVRAEPNAPNGTVSAEVPLAAPFPPPTQRARPAPIPARRSQPELFAPTGSPRSRRTVALAVALPLLLLVAFAGSRFWRAASAERVVPNAEAPSPAVGVAQPEPDASAADSAAARPEQEATAAIEDAGVVATVAEGEAAAADAGAQRSEDEADRKVARTAAAERPQRSRRSSVIQTGWLSIDAKPAWGEVKLDGASLGPTPIFRKQVRAGRHRVEVVRSDGMRRTVTVDVPPNRMKTVVVTW